MIVENLAIKQGLMARLEAVRKPHAIVSTNTSGLRINAIAEGRSDDFKRHFLGTHFFNPPRYLKLLEIIPHTLTDPGVLDFMMDYGENILGKGVVLCKDTPNFIANRFISLSGTFGVNYALDHGYTVEEVDNLTGPLIGRPKTATFRLNDLVGTDIMVHVNRNLYPAIPDDEAREVLQPARSRASCSHTMLDQGMAGQQGRDRAFTSASISPTATKNSGNSTCKRCDYEPPAKVRFESVGEHRKIEDTGARIKAMVNRPRTAPGSTSGTCTPST